jgi:hypothetical protein
MVLANAHLDGIPACMQRESTRLPSTTGAIVDFSGAEVVHQLADLELVAAHSRPLYVAACHAKGAPLFVLELLQPHCSERRGVAPATLRKFDVQIKSGHRAEILNQVDDALTSPRGRCVRSHGVWR